MAPIALAWAALLLMPAVAAAAVDNPAGLLAAARRKVMETVDRLPRYLCTQTVERRESQIPGGESVGCSALLASERKPKLLTTDRLRIDVAISGDQEIYSWVGENRFQERGLFSMVGSGTMSNGAFSGFLSVIFYSNDPTFLYIGEEPLEGRPAAKYQFNVPVERSRYHIGGPSGAAAVPYSGTVWVDPKTANLLRMVVQVTKPPLALSWCSSSTTFDYHVVRLRDTDFLLPQSTVLRVITAAGTEAVNRTVYSGCHEFLGQSTIKFDVPPVGEDTVPKAAPAIAIPDGIPFMVEFPQTLDAATLATGDPLRLRLVNAIQHTASGLRIPAGAPVNVRIVRSQTIAHPPVTVTTINMESIEVDGQTIPLAARYDVPPNRALGRITTITSPTAYFEFPSRSARFKRGQRMSWITGAYKERN